MAVATSADPQEPGTQIEAQGARTQRPAPLKPLPCTPGWLDSHTTEAVRFSTAGGVQGRWQQREVI